jgi:5-(carboxyamino)imidazole ribonucleotide synthase
MDSRTGLPVVGMVGAGQLARMTHQAAISLGQSLQGAGRDARTNGAGLVAGEVVYGSPHRPGRAAGFRRRCARCVTFDHEHVPGEHLLTLVMPRA